MLDELAIGKRYRVTLRSRTFAGYLEGVLRSTRLPPGAPGNDDGEHCIWLIGELFEWFLRPREIATIEELADPTGAAFTILPRAVCEAPLHPAGIRGSLGSTASIRSRVAPRGARSCASRPRRVR